MVRASADRFRAKTGRAPRSEANARWPKIFGGGGNA
jgi:hypothetical protein